MSLAASAATGVANHLGTIADADLLAAEIDEPLAKSAPMAFALARHNCATRGPANDCRAYHAIWQYLRLTGIARSVRSDGPLFVAAAERLARVGRLRRVLVCGTADYSMLAYLGHAARRVEAETSFDVLDHCATTLQLNDWYGKHANLRVRTICADVLAFEPDEPYDLVCTHSFLAWLDYEKREQLVMKWRDWLKPGGELAFSNRIDLLDGPPRSSDHGRRAETMTGEFFQRCTEMNLELPVDRESFRELIRQFCERSLHRRRDMPMETLQNWLGNAGLDLDLAVLAASVVPNNRDRASSPVQEEGRPRVWFLARRP